MGDQFAIPTGDEGKAVRGHVDLSDEVGEVVQLHVDAKNRCKASLLVTKSSGQGDAEAVDQETIETSPYRLLMGCGDPVPGPCPGIETHGRDRDGFPVPVNLVSPDVPGIGVGRVVSQAEIR